MRHIKKEIAMFEKWVSTTGRRNYENKYRGELIVSVKKFHVWMSDEVIKVLGHPAYYCVLSNEKEWAIRASDETEEGAYLAGGDSHSKDDPSEKCLIRPVAFIKAVDIPVGYLYKGKLQDGMVIFSKKPLEKA